MKGLWPDFWRFLRPAKDKPPPPPDDRPRRWSISWGSSRFWIELGIALFFLGLAVWIIIAVVRFFLGVGEAMDKLGP
jgi:hypothetical protein